LKPLMGDDPFAPRLREIRKQELFRMFAALFDG
jgi:hypothetical protein